MMKIHSSARCCFCEQSMGRPVEVIEYEERLYTEYECVSCSEVWARPHNLDSDMRSRI
jgi:hypothetical protein